MGQEGLQVNQTITVNPNSFSAAFSNFNNAELELPTLLVSSRNEGESESRVWAMDQLNVKGEGESVMYYIGNPEVYQDLNGFASLINVKDCRYNQKGRNGFLPFLIPLPGRCLF